VLLAVRRARSGDEAVLRALRIEALTDAPAAFDSTLERELRRTPEGTPGPCARAL